MRIKGETGLEEGIEEDAEGPGVSGLAVVGLAQDDLWRGVVFGAAAGFEFLIFDYAAGETKIGEGNYGVGVGNPVGDRVSKLRGLEID